MRRLLCAIGWHCTEQVTARGGAWGPLHRCVYCGTEDYEDEWLTLWRHK